MPITRSIKQKPSDEALPDFRSLGVILRTLLLANGLALSAILLGANSWSSVMQYFLRSAALLQPILLSSLLLLYILQPKLELFPYRQGVMSSLAIVAVSALGAIFLGGDLYLPVHGNYTFFVVRQVMLSILAAAVILMYFRWRHAILSPAIYQAHLQALQARIRPHFLFNCINTVLSVVRNDPRRAETALEDMSDLFRMAMTASDDMVALSQEIELSRRYLELEKLRLGERLQVEWHSEHLPPDAMTPPLLLQPLLENAVYHGIEPLPEGGVIRINIGLQAGEIVIAIQNPRAENHEARHDGHKLALANIRERLALLFDIEAHYMVESSYNFYKVQITMPYIKEGETSA